jgi:hypothetical protein
MAILHSFMADASFAFYQIGRFDYLLQAAGMNKIPDENVSLTANRLSKPPHAGSGIFSFHAFFISESFKPRGSYNRFFISINHLFKVDFLVVVMDLKSRVEYRCHELSRGLHPIPDVHPHRSRTILYRR